MAGNINMGDNPTLNHTLEKLGQHTVPDWIATHLEEYARDPVKGHLWDGSAFGAGKNVPTLLLTTRGRKSGRELVMPLIYGKDGDRYVLIGSKGGAPEHPAWYLNMQADPVVGLQVAHDKFKARARTVTGEERKRLFEMMTTVYPPFPSYQAKTPRELPVVVLEEI